ncbi:MAG: hypothetical protein FWG63_07120 [Defluviitaleaceae bacterium]|nr:hypothetical protein [Defluviitaleaceae bacterium]
MYATYQNFLDENPRCGKALEHNINSRDIFMILSREDNIIKMIDVSEAGRPAVEAVVACIEEYFELNKNADFDLNNKQRRTVIGYMIRTILQPFGYYPLKPASRTQKKLLRSVDTKHFQSGSCYEFDPNAPATMEVIRSIREIAK